jgi:hypothetical protein
VCVIRKIKKKITGELWRIERMRVLCARVYYNKKIMFFPRGNTEKAKVSGEERKETFRGTIKSNLVNN